MRKSKKSVKTIGLDFYARCSSPRCGTAAVIYADQTIPLCLDHAEAVWRHLSDALPNSASRRSVRTVDRPVQRSTFTDLDRPAVVYYAGVGDHVKIGHTRNPNSRWRALSGQYGPNLAILVVEPGGQAVEFARQAQFAHLRVGVTELFRRDTYLESHVDRLQQQYPDWLALAQASHDAWRAQRSDETGKRRGNLFVPGRAA